MTIPTDVARRRARNNVRRIALLFLSACYVVLWVGGVAQYWLKGGVTTDQSWLAAVFLVMSGTIVLVGTRVWRERWLLVAVAVFGFFAEAAGVHLNVPFGPYIYTEALGLKLLGVPLAMAFAWMTLAAYAKQMLLRFNLAAWVETIIAALWMTAFDLLIDPLASNQLGYWRWANKGLYYGVPLTNFAGWFVVSLLAFQILKIRFASNLLVRLTGLSIILFFTLLAAALGSGFIALLGCVLCLLDIFLFSAPK